MSSGQGKAEGQAPPRAAGRGRRLWMLLALGVFLLPTLVVLFPTAIVVAALMLPTLVAYMVDRTPGRAFTMTVGLLNGAGTLPGVLQLWSKGHSLLATQDVLSNMIFWLSAYVAAAVGWCIFLMLPPILRTYYDAITDTRVGALQKKQDKLRELWGDEVTGQASSAPKHAEKDPDAQMDAAAEHLVRN